MRAAAAYMSGELVVSRAKARRSTARACARGRQPPPRPVNGSEVDPGAARQRVLATVWQLIEWLLTRQCNE